MILHRSEISIQLAFLDFFLRIRRHASKIEFQEINSQGKFNMQVLSPELVNELQQRN